MRKPGQVNEKSETIEQYTTEDGFEIFRPFQFLSLSLQVY